MFLRVETGDLFNTLTPGLPSVQSIPRWTYVRLEGGEEVLMGPATVTPERGPIELRVEFGDVIPLTLGVAP